MKILVDELNKSMDVIHEGNGTRMVLASFLKNEKPIMMIYLKQLRAIMPKDTEFVLC